MTRSYFVPAIAVKRGKGLKMSRQFRKVELPVFILFAVAAFTPAACGAIPTASTSATPAAPSPSATTSVTPPDPSALTTANCSGPTPAAAPRLLNNYYTVRIASGWSDSGKAGYESLLLELVAPDAYAYKPTKMEFFSVPSLPISKEYGPQATAHSIAATDASSIAQVTATSGAMATAVKDCTIGGELAAVYGYSAGTAVGYRIDVVHNDHLKEWWLFGSGGISTQAVADALQMLGSIQWAA